MIFSTIKNPDISEYMQYIFPVQLSSDVSLLLIYKQLFRSDEVVVDIYLNEISDATKLTSGKIVSSDALICQPNYDLGFDYYIHCLDTDCIKQSVNKYNLHKFYLQFTSYNGKEWDLQ